MTTKAPATALCSNCKAPLPPGSTWRTVYCEDCKAKHIAAWKDEHTRKPGDTRKGWLIGDECIVKLKGITYQARIVDMSDVSRRESDHDLMCLELSKTVVGLDGKSYTQSWIHRDPVQSYRLKKALLK